MKKASKSSARAVKPRDKLLPKISVFFFEKTKLTLFLWIALSAFGLLCYTTLLKREGFPSVNVPVAIVGGTYFVNDASRVDNDVAKPLSDFLLQNESIKAVQSQSSDNFFTVSLQYVDNVDARATTTELENQIREQNILPQGANAQFNVPYFGVTGGDVRKIDIAISFYSLNPTATTAEVNQKAEEFAAALREKNIDLVTEVFVKNAFEQTVNPATGDQVTVQRSFDQFGTRQNNETTFFNSTIVAITAVDNVDVIKLDENVQTAVDEINNSDAFPGYSAAISASFAPNIENNISELQKVLIEGLIAILIVGSIVIAIRASFITVISLITIVLFTLASIYLIGYTLNVITLFALILALALIVDDTIIMVEAIDAARHKHKERREIIRDATQKIARAMVAATLTAALSFAPLIFVGGLLGGFIRAIPVTIIIALLISLVVALVFIPYFSRYLLLTKKNMGKKAKKEFSEGFESKLANFVAGPMLWARNSKKRLFGVGTAAVCIGFAFIIAGGFIASRVIFNIFPPTKDTNGLVLSMRFPQGTDISNAERIARDADAVVARELGENFVQSSYFSSGSAQDATHQVQIISYTKRDVTSVELVDKLQKAFDETFTEARVSVGQQDVGPPSTAFVVEVDAENREQAFVLANDLASHMNQTTLERPNGTTAKFVNVNVSSPDQYLRNGGNPIITVTAGFDGTDTSTLVTLAQSDIEEWYNQDRVDQYGLGEEAIQFNLGQESENQDSFRTLLFAFPALLLVMYFLLAIQFRSLLQPLLIFMAIPFSIFGVMLGLYLTDNAISFFSMLGFFALIGLSIKNTILLTDYSNQARRSGMSAVDAAVEGLKERFRPLFATSATAVVSLIPLALTSPFWEGLAVVLIFGLISSTFLVVTVFPYYYLGAEYLRIKISTKQFFIWLAITLVIAIAVGFITNPGLGFLVVPLSLLFVLLQRFYEERV